MAMKKAAAKKVASKKGDEPVRVGQKKTQPDYRGNASPAQRAAVIKQAEKVFGKGNFELYAGGDDGRLTAGRKNGGKSSASARVSYAARTPKTKTLTSGITGKGGLRSSKK